MEDGQTYEWGELCECGHYELAHGGKRGVYDGACLAATPSGEPDALNRFVSKPCACQAFTAAKHREKLRRAS